MTATEVFAYEMILEWKVILKKPRAWSVRKLKHGYSVQTYFAKFPVSLICKN